MGVKFSRNPGELLLAIQIDHEIQIYKYGIVWVSVVSYYVFNTAPRIPKYNKH